MGQIPRSTERISSSV